ncbi:hypothetical protein Tco_1205451, partial [Tanacetum coccineum]
MIVKNSSRLKDSGLSKVERVKVIEFIIESATAVYQILEVLHSKRPPVTTTVFAATTPENTSFAYRASTSANPNPMISLAFVEANYELEPRPRPTRETTLPLRLRSPGVRMQRKRVVGFEEAPNREGSRAGRNAEGSMRRNAEGSMPLEIKVKENGKTKGRNDVFPHYFRGQKSKDRFSPYRGPNHGLLSSMCKSTREILTTEKIARSFEQPPRMFKSRRSRAFPPCERNKEKAKSSKNRVEGKKDKGATPAKAPILMIRQKESYTRDNASEDFISGGREITFPSVIRGSNSSAPVVIKAKIFGREDNNAENGNHSFHHPQSHQIPHAKGIKTVFSTHESDKIKEGTKKVR